ncbi:MAG TPA: hypothetical protein VKU87_04105, partial [Thermomicrobiaceae bacterium]|nr:hypothetical protein [Thermomicrobiaceae bacterium]
RYIQTLADIAVEQNSTVIFPIPLDLIKPIMGIIDKLGDGAATSENPDRETPNGAAETPNMLEEPNEILGQLLDRHSPHTSETIGRAGAERGEDEEITEE